MILDNLKQLSFYTDIFSSAKWSSPKKVIDKELATMIFSVAQSIVKIDRVMTTEKELELWIKHLKTCSRIRKRLNETSSKELLC